MVNETNKYTVITGASSGIGYETAKAFASRGKNVIIIARRKEKLAKLQKEILEKFPTVGLLFGNGAASYLSRLLGNGDKEKADKVASTALYSSITVGAIMIIFSVIFLQPILKLLGATDSIMPYAITYASIYIVSCIFNVFNVTMNNIVTSEGAAKTTMLALMAGAILNIGLDPVFIYL